MVAPGDTGVQRGGEGAPQRIRRERRRGPGIGPRDPPDQLNVADIQQHDPRQAGPRAAQAEEHPVPGGVQDQVHGQAGRQRVPRAAAGAAQRTACRPRDACVQRGPDQPERRRRGLPARLVQAAVPGAVRINGQRSGRRGGTDRYGGQGVRPPRLGRRGCRPGGRDACRSAPPGPPARAAGHVSGPSDGGIVRCKSARTAWAALRPETRAPCMEGVSRWSPQT